jgi:hypothetical protein
MPNNKYDKIHKDLMNFLLNQGTHSTIVGKQIVLGGSNSSNIQQAEELTEYIVDLIKKSGQFRKDNVKKIKK